MAFQVRLACPRACSEPICALSYRYRRAEDSFHPSAVQGQERHPSNHHARVPGSFVEFTKIIGPLTNPIAYGWRSEDAFHVVCPSLPGYGFSEAPRKSGFGLKQIAEILVKLMARLGYTQYGAHGGDWGSYISCWIAALDTPHVNGLHLIDTVANPQDTWEKTSPEAKRKMEQQQLSMLGQELYSPHLQT